MGGNSKSLGRGLEAMFHSNTIQNGLVAESADPAPFMLIEPERLSPNPAQPRCSFSEESISELADSIRAQGIVQPLIARPATTPGEYEIIAGERRWRAAKMAGLERVPVLVRQMDNVESMIVALIENMEREDLNPMEEARGLAALKNLMGVTQEVLAERIGHSRAAISNSMRLLNLSSEAQDDLLNNRITASHARCLLAIPDESAAEEFRSHMLETGMTSREAELAAKHWNDTKSFPWNKNGRPQKLASHDPQIVHLAKEIGATLNCRTKIRGNQEKGTISLSYASNAQLYDLLEKLGLSMSS